MSERLTPADLDAIRARVEAATPGPWKLDWDSRPYPREGMPWCTFAIGPQHGIPADPTASPGAKAMHADAEAARNADATFIAAARQDVPALLAEIARLTAEVERMGAMVPRWTYTERGRTWRLLSGGARLTDSGLSAFPDEPVLDLTTGDEYPDLPSAARSVCARLGLHEILPPEAT